MSKEYIVIEAKEVKEKSTPKKQTSPKTSPKPKEPNKNKELLKDIGKGFLATAEMTFILIMKMFKGIMNLSEKLFKKVMDKSKNGTKKNNKASRWN